MQATTQMVKRCMQKTSQDKLVALNTYENNTRVHNMNMWEDIQEN